ncbi:hypothetical protein BC629DRAFT_1587558 [Irpex lacteus]|nr:hypothetical protein BC629DRAFT_1587558 [Irpex lacteus]
MFSTTKLASFAILAAAVGVQAQSSSAAPAIPSGLSTCLITCVTTAASDAGCSSFTDLQCVCTNPTFLSSATSCLQSSCTSADQQAALQLQSTECAGIAASSGASGSSAAASTPAPSASLTTASGSSGSSVVLVTSSGSGSGSSTLSFPSGSGSASGSASPSGSSSASRKDFGLNVNAIIGGGVAVVAAIAGAGLVL